MANHRAKLQSRPGNSLFWGRTDSAEAFKIRKYEARPVDETANFLTHGFGFLLSIVASIYLLNVSLFQPDLWMAIACAVYSLTLTGLYLASTLSHAFYDPVRRRYYRMLDQAAIFLLIAGSFTPYAAAYLKQGMWPLLTLVVWATALTGAYLVFHWGYLTASGQKLYLLMGWFPAIGMAVIFKEADISVTLWIVAGGLAYTGGTWFLWNDRRAKYMHALWHLSVIVGSAMHYAGILAILSTQSS